MLAPPPDRALSGSRFNPEQSARRPHPAFGIDAVNAMLAQRPLNPPGNDEETGAALTPRRQRAPPLRVEPRSHPQAAASRTAPPHLLVSHFAGTTNSASATV